MPAFYIFGDIPLSGLLSQNNFIASEPKGKSYHSQLFQVCRYLLWKR
jgi:hypothetical protein